MARPTPGESLERVRSAVGNLISNESLVFGHVDVTVSPENLVELVKTLRDHDDLRFRFFTFLSGVDRSTFGGDDDEEKEGRGGLEVLIHLYSPDHVMHINIHVPLPLEGAECPSITGVFAGALWHERETWEMFGIHFAGHPRLVNLYLPEDFEGNPLLKSFRLPTRIVKPWPGAKDPEEAAAGGR
ncbi:MAG TPA: NADH-quinone oxidoreductase subunit C [Actinomycetota bacterium]|nr:NADH-quinone oxidoreductase subunit C [Actinomycetota bacterium]